MKLLYVYSEKLNFGGINFERTVLFAIFKGISTLFSIVAVLVCIPTNSLRGFPFLHTLSSIYLDCRHSDWCEVVPHCGFDLHCSDNEWCWASFHSWWNLINKIFNNIKFYIFHSFFTLINVIVLNVKTFQYTIMYDLKIFIHLINNICWACGRY